MPCSPLLLAFAFLLVHATNGLAATKTWTGGGDGVSWDDPINWTGGTLPGSTSDVVIPVLAGNPTIQITVTAQARSLTCQLPINISSGSLTLSAPSTINAPLTVTSSTLTVTGIGASLIVGGALAIDSSIITVSGSSTFNGPLTVTSSTITVSGSATFNGPLTVTSSTLTVSGSGTSVSVPGATTLTGANLYAEGGAVLSLPGCTSYTGSNYADTTISASGAGSKIDLSHLLTFSGGGAHTNGFGNSFYFTTHVLPTGGGEIDLAGDITSNGYRNDFTVRKAGSSLKVTTVTTVANTNFTASGAGCGINLSSIPVAGISGSSVSMSALNGGTIDLGDILTAAGGLTLSATFGSASDVPFTFNGGSGTGKTLNLALNFAPAPGTALMVLKNSSATAMSKFFSNRGQFQVMSLAVGSQTYNLRANYNGGSGTDLVLEHPGSLRLLPPKVAVGVPTTVAIVVLPMPTYDGYVVEDVPPSGWLVTNISDGGVYDSVFGRVRWEFADHVSRMLTYDVTPTGSHSLFTGTGLFDEQECTVIGSVQSTVVATLTKPELALLPFRLLSGETALSLATRPGHTYVIEVSADMMSWLPLLSRTVTGGGMPFLDPGAIGQPRRFYRAAEQ